LVEARGWMDHGWMEHKLRNEEGSLGRGVRPEERHQMRGGGGGGI